MYQVCGFIYKKRIKKLWSFIKTIETELKKLKTMEN